MVQKIAEWCAHGRRVAADPSHPSSRLLAPGPSATSRPTSQPPLLPSARRLQPGDIRRHHVAGALPFSRYLKPTFGLQLAVALHAERITSETHRRALAASFAAESWRQTTGITPTAKISIPLFVFFGPGGYIVIRNGKIATDSKKSHQLASAWLLELRCLQLCRRSGHLRRQLGEQRTRITKISGAS